MATQNEEARAAIEGVDLDDESAKLSDKRWSIACWLLADLAEHSAKDDVRAARSMTDAYLYAMTALDSIVSLVYTMPASRQEYTVRVNHLTVRSNVADNDPRLEVITPALRGGGRNNEVGAWKDVTDGRAILETVSIHLVTFTSYSQETRPA